MVNSPTLFERIAAITPDIPPNVKLIAVSKQVPASTIRLAYEAGIRDFGENRIQEAIAKQAELEDLPDIIWHFIGHLQSNKARKALLHFQYIHSVDNLKLAQRLNHLAQELDLKPLVCLQVKILPDPNKSGWDVTQLMADLPELHLCNNLQIQGLMTIPPLGLNNIDVKKVFINTKNLGETIKASGFANLQIKHLSMGMSGDYKIAIEAGATMVRLGSILFGERSK
ncbi:MAG: YggS family pyridoxal phosphate-dependent enzyme [Cyanobacteria bacterium P01_A01_bin.84]